MKLFIFIVSLFVSVLSFAQDNIIYKFSGVITNTDLGKKEAGVTVSLMKDGQQLASGVSGTNGKYGFNYTGPIGMKFVIVYSKAGLVNKRLSFDGSKMNIEDVLAGSEVQFPGDVSMFAERQGVDFSFLNSEPYVILSWDPNQMGVVPDMAALNKMKKKVDDLLAKAPAPPNEDDAKFTEAVKAGDALFGQKKYQEAIVKFELANGIKPKEKYPTDKILECEKLLAAEKKDQLAAQQADQEYTNLVKAADNLRDQKKYDDAIAKYNEAIKKKSTDPYPSQQIAAVNKLKDEEKNKAAQETKLKELVAAGDKAVTGSKFDEAKTKYEEALALKQDPAVKTKLDGVNAKIAEAKAKDQAKAKYEALISEANSLQASGKLTESKAKFQEAGKLDPTQTIPPSKIKEIDDLITKGAADKQKTDKYNAAISAAEQLQASGKLKEAKAKYQEASTIDPAQTVPKQKITEIDNLIAGEAAAADKKLKVDKLIADGSALLAKNDFENSKLKFEEVLKLDASNAVSQTKLNEINTKQNALKGQAEKDKQFELLKTEGFKLATDKKWSEAKTKLEEANTIKVDPTVAAKLKEIDAAISGDKQKTDKYNAAISAAEQLQASGKLKEAKAKYQEASTIDPTQNGPKQKLTEIDNLLAGDAAAADKKLKVDKLITDGSALLAKNDFENSKLKFEEVLKLDASNAVAQAKINEINTKQNALKGQAEKDKQFELLKAEGFKLAADKKWSAAKTKLEEANTIKVDPTVTAKLKEIDAAIRANDGQAQLEKDYAKLLADAEILVNSKNYDGAIAKYKEAQTKKPTEALPKTKIAELEELKKNSSNQAQIDAKYKALMAEGDKFVVTKNYVEAIKKFNEALVLKPSEKEPVDKAKSAEELAKNQGSEGKVQYEKIISLVEKAITEKDFVRGKELIGRAKKLNPSDKRPDELLAQINALELVEKQYNDKIVLAENFEKAKDYKKAIAEYENAKKIKPQEIVPPNKIEELNKLIAGQNSDIEKNKLYLDAVLLGEKLVKEKKYSEAMASFQNALQIKGGDAQAKSKISEVQQLIDNQTASIGNSNEKKAQYDKYIKVADGLFQQKNYLEAKKSYELALTQIVNDKYATKQVIEADRLIREGSSVEIEKAYKLAIKSGDNLFSGKDYLKAKEDYTKALGLKPKDSYALKKLKELDVLLNSTVSATEKLEPLGEPVDNNSLIDGMAALNQAEKDRQKLEKAKLAEQIKGANTKEQSLDVQKQEEHLKATDDLFNVQTTVETTSVQKDDNRKETVSTYSTLNKEKEKEDFDADNFEKGDILQSQDKLSAIELQNQKDASERSTSANENGDVIKKYNNTNGNKLIDGESNEQTENISSNQKVRAIELKTVLNPENDDEQRKNAQTSIEDKDLKSSNDFETTELKKANEREGAEKTIDVVTNVMSEKDYVNSLRAPKLADEVKQADIEINKVQVAEVDKDREAGFSGAKQVAELVSKTSAEFTEKDENRKESTETLKVKNNEVKSKITSESNKDELAGFEASKITDDAHTKMNTIASSNDENRKVTVEVYKATEKQQEQTLFEKDKKEQEKYQGSKDLIESERAKDEGTAVQEKSKNDKNVAETKKLVKKTSDNYSSTNNVDNEQITKADNGLHDANVIVSSNTATSVEAEKVNTALMQDVTKSMKDEVSKDLNKQDDKHYKAQESIHDKQKEPDPKPIVKNAIGSQYPEGVSQESFTQKDQNGLMTSIITRRIVVIEGKGTVYVRTQTLQATTYSKNDQPISEYVWQKETQGSNLKRNY
jgi:PIN domain nuclease of toxin-antitoxin system